MRIRTTLRLSGSGHVGMMFAGARGVPGCGCVMVWVCDVGAGLCHTGAAALGMRIACVIVAIILASMGCIQGGGHNVLIYMHLRVMRLCPQFGFFGMHALAPR